MALVAYDNSDSSEFEDEENENATVVILDKEEKKPSYSESVVENESVDLGHSLNLFNLLPQPSSKKPTVVEEEDDEFLHKKETVTNVTKPKAKISVPSLSDFKDVESTVPIAKPKAGKGKGSGLLSILPQPKNSLTTTTTKSLIPHVLTQKPNSATVKKKVPSPQTTEKVEITEKSLPLDYSDDSDNDDVQNDFFSMNKVVELPEDMPLDINKKSTDEVEIKNLTTPSSQKQMPNIQSYFKQNMVDNHVELQTEYTESTNSEAEHYEAMSANHSNDVETESTNSNEVTLDEEAILKLCGARGKRKREEIQIVDVNQQEVLADAREWLLKGLMDDTSKRVSSSKKRGNEPTSQQRRKHQITYLAHQAKANEIELQNQWANNRMSKRQTQSKYGF